MKFDLITKIESYEPNSKTNINERVPMACQRDIHI